jgi:hypothetical protein
MKKLSARKAFFTVVASAITALGATSSAVAGTAAPQNSFKVTIKNPLAFNGTIDQIIDNILNFLLTIGVPIAGLMFVWAGFLLLTSGGQEKTVATAKKTMIYAAIGLAVLILSKGLVALVKTIIA